jgi:hypothetical protein
MKDIFCNITYKIKMKMQIVKKFRKLKINLKRNQNRMGKSTLKRNKRKTNVRSVENSAIFVVKEETSFTFAAIRN